MSRIERLDDSVMDVVRRLGSSSGSEYDVGRLAAWRLGTADPVQQRAIDEALTFQRGQS